MERYPGITPNDIADMTPTQQNAALNPELNPDDNSIRFSNHEEYQQWLISRRSHLA